jgi:hypothetical protein
MTAITTLKIPAFERYRRLLVALARADSLDEVALKLLPILAKLGLALPAAFLVWRTISPLKQANGTYRLLVIEKAIFNIDILEVLKDTDEVQAFGVKRAIIKALALGILPRSVCGDDTYISHDPAVAAAKIRYLKLWRKLWYHLHMFGRYDGVITGNWCYWAEREMATALEEAGAPFIVLHKEGIKPPERSKMLCELFRKTRGGFTGRRVLVYHEKERDHQLAADISRLDQIRIVGMPRLDRIHAWRREAASGSVAHRAKRPIVLFLAFLPNNFLPSYSGIESDLAWSELCTGFYQAAVIFARRNPGVEVIIRPRGYEISETAALIPGGGLPANLRLDPIGDVVDVIKDAWAICGHNTTVLFEALAAGKPVIMPSFGEALNMRYHGYIVDMAGAVELAETSDELVVRLERICAAPPPISEKLSAAAEKALWVWTGNGDGKSAARAYSAIIDELKIAKLG